MASSSILFLSLTVSVAIFVISIPHSRAVDQALLDKICQRTSVYDLCKSTLSNNIQFGAADIHGLCMISISNSRGHAEATLSKITSMGGGLRDPVDKQRNDICKLDYGNAIDMFKEAFNSANTKRDYIDVVDRVRDGANKAIDCENGYRSDPIRQSPISSDNHKMVDFVDVVLAIVDVIQSG